MHEPYMLYELLAGLNYHFWNIKCKICIHMAKSNLLLCKLPSRAVGQRYPHTSQLCCCLGHCWGNGTALRNTWQAAVSKCRSVSSFSLTNLRLEGKEKASFSLRGQGCS